MNFKSDVIFSQRFLACAGLYTDKIDGLYGNNSRKAEDAFNKLSISPAGIFSLNDDFDFKYVLIDLKAAQYLFDCPETKKQRIF